MVNKDNKSLDIFYKEDIVPILMKEFNLKNRYEVARLDKIVLNIGLGEAKTNSKSVDVSKEVIRVISGQEPIVTKAKKSIAGFKLREGTIIGVKVTLRRKKMWDFLYKLINISLPRVRDFRGINSKFDGKGNCTIGIKEQLIFPEVNYDKLDRVRGLNISLVTSSENSQIGKALLKYLGIPFRN